MVHWLRIENARVRSSGSKISAILVKVQVFMNLAVQIHKSQLDKDDLLFHPPTPSQPLIPSIVSSQTLFTTKDLFRHLNISF